MTDHPLLVASLPFTPPDRLTQKARLARPAPSVGGTGWWWWWGGKMRELTSGPLTVAQPAKAARVIWFLSFVDSVPEPQEWIKQGNSAWRALPPWRGDPIVSRE